MRCQEIFGLTASCVSQDGNRPRLLLPVVALSLILRKESTPGHRLQHRQVRSECRRSYEFFAPYFVGEDLTLATEIGSERLRNFWGRRKAKIARVVQMAVEEVVVRQEDTEMQVSQLAENFQLFAENVLRKSEL